MIKKVEFKLNKAAKLIIKQLKKYISIDKKLAKWENEQLLVLKEQIVDVELLTKVELRIDKNNKLLAIHIDSKLDKVLKKIIKKVSPTIYEEIPNEILDAYALSIAYYRNSDLKGLMQLDAELNSLELPKKTCDLNEVLKVLKIESMKKNYDTYSNVRKKQINEFLMMVSNKTFNIN